MLCAVFPHVPVLALTATANKTDIKNIQCSLGLKVCIEVVVNPDRPNIYYEKHFREGNDIEAIEKIIMPIAKDLLKSTIEYPLTIIYLSLRWCGFAYRLFEHVMGNAQYYPSGSDAVPNNRLFAQFHSPQTQSMKDNILKQLSSSKSTIRVVFATVAMGMGIDIRSIRVVIHIGPPRSIREYVQETGRAGRDGKQSTAVLYYNNKDIANNRCQTNNCCLRKLLLEFLDASQPKSIYPGHICCSVCRKSCSCEHCADINK